MIEKADKHDIDAIMDMEKMCFDRDAWPRRMIEEEIAGGTGRRARVVRDKNGTAVAYCIARAFMDEMEIFKLAVHPFHRRKGMALTLLRDAMRDLGRGSITLEVAADNKEAILLYSKTGFKTLGLREKYYSNSGRDALIMRAVIGE